MITKDKVAGLVVLYNPDESVTGNILTYLSEIDKLFVIDNSSKKSDVIVSHLQGFRVTYIFNNENLGIAKALNQGAEQAFIEGYEWLLTMDQDSKFSEGIFKVLCETESLTEKKYKGKTGIIAPFHLEDSHTLPLFKGDYQEELAVFTSGNLLNLKIYKQTDGFDEKLFMDYVDFAYCFQLRKLGYYVIQSNRAILNHKLGNTIFHTILGVNITVTNHSYIRRYYLTRNRFYVNKQYKKSLPNYFHLQYIDFIKDLIRVSFFEKDKIRKWNSIWKGWRDFRKNRIGKNNMI